MNITRTIELHGHRGARGLMPENTLPAFQKAIELGINFLELDIVITKDKQIIVHHDTEINPNLCIHKNRNPLKRELISNWTLAEIKELDCGSIKNIRFPEQQILENTSIPTLKEVIALVKEYEKKNPGKSRLKLNIELKFPEVYSKSEIQEFVNLFIKLIEEEKFIEQSIVQSFELFAIQEIKRLRPRIVTSALFEPSKFDLFRLRYFSGESIRTRIIEKAKQMNATYVSPYYLYVTKEFIDLAHSNGLKVLPWTVNNKEDMIKLYEFGVDGIISDYPDRMMDLFKIK